MFHYTNQNTTLSSNRRQLTSNNDNRSMNEVYFHPYDGTGAPARALSSVHGRSASDMNDNFNTSTDFEYSAQSGWEDDDDEPMDILYEQEVEDGSFPGDPRHHRHSTGDLRAVHHTNAHHHTRHHSEPINMGSSSFDLQLTTTADHLMALLQREANDYSVPLPVRYYPSEFTDIDSSEDNQDDKKSSKTSIGPWRKRIASWMYDVVDHFQYDRNVVSVALRFIDQYVGHLLVEHDRRHKRAESGIGSSRGRSSSSSSSSQPIKRRHFQLIAVTSLYLAIKVHGELMENDPTTGDEYDVVASLVHEVDGRAFLGKPLDKALDNNDDDEEDASSKSSQESDDDLRHVNSKLSELKRRQRKGRRFLSNFSLPIGHHHTIDQPNSSRTVIKMAKVPKAAHSNLPYKPRKRGMLSGPLRLHSFVELSRGLFTSRDITDTEKKILVALNYVVNPPTSRRFVGEQLRMLALCFTSAVDGVGGVLPTDAEVMATAAERMLGIDRKEILDKVLANACAQIEGAASVPSLSIGCLPSVLAYGAMVNAVEEEFEKLVASEGKDLGMDAIMEMEREDIMEPSSSPQLEDFQRHYRRYSRNTSPSPTSNSTPANVESDRELFLEAWKEQFLVTVFHATNCFLSPESQDIYKVRELLLDQVSNGTEDGTPTTSPGSSSPTEGSKQSPKKRSPRSPRSVTLSNSPNRQQFRGGSFFHQRSGSNASSTTSLLSPYDSQGRTVSAKSVASPSFHSVYGSSTSTGPRRSHYYKQTSAPIISEVPDMNNREHCLDTAKRYRRFVSQSSDVSQTINRPMSANFDNSSWRISADAFQPPNPANPLFSA